MAEEWFDLKLRPQKPLVGIFLQEPRCADNADVPTLVGAPV